MAVFVSTCICVCLCVCLYGQDGVALNLHIFLCWCVCAGICISALIRGCKKQRGLLLPRICGGDLLFLSFMEAIPESWKDGCLLRRQRDEGARWDANPNRRLI